jgi:hypothetical protein
MPLAVVLGDLLYLFWEAEMQKMCLLGIYSCPAQIKLKSSSRYQVLILSRSSSINFSLQLLGKCQESKIGALWLSSQSEI